MENGENGNCGIWKLLKMKNCGKRTLWRIEIVEMETFKNKNC